MKRKWILEIYSQLPYNWKKVWDSIRPMHGVEAQNVFNSTESAGFCVDSASLTISHLRYERSVEMASITRYTVVIDRLVIQPRIAPTGYIIAWCLRRTFEQRHSRLRKQFR